MPLRLAVLAVAALAVTGCSAGAAAPEPSDAVTVTESPSAEPGRALDGPPRVVTISGSGDILIHPSLWARAQSDGGAAGPTFDRELAGAAARIRASDYSICHVEQGFNDPNGPTTSYPNYYTHPVLAEAIAGAGFDACSTASNWTFLKGLDGIARTNRALQRAGVTPAGSAARRTDGPRFRIDEVDGVRIAHLSYTEPGESPTVPGAPWAVNDQSPAEIAEDARAAREAGADIVVVSLAMGQMGSAQTTAAQRKAVRTIAAGGDVDYIVGHGSHTIQPAEKVGDTWVVWHGNLLSSFFPDQPRLHEGLISTATFTEQPDGRFRVTDLQGGVVLALPQSGRIIDISAEECSAVPYRWQEAYAATKAVERRAIADGLRLAKPCRGNTG